MTVRLLNRGNKTGKTSIRLKRTLMILFALLFVMAIVAVSIVYANYSDNDGNSVVATINGEPVTYKEFKLSMAGNRAKVAASYSGEIAMEKLKQSALDSILKIKVAQILAKQKGIVQDISYDTFVRNLDIENKRRTKAYEKHEVIFGPVQYSESEYYDLVNANLVGELKKAYRKDSKLSEEQLKQYYEINKELYKQQDTIRIEKITASGADAEKVLKTFKANMDNGMNLQQASSKYKEQVKVEEQVFDAGTAHSDTLAHPVTLQMAVTLKQGQMSDIFEENGVHVLIRCIERKVVGYRAFEEVKEAIRDYLAGRAYAQAIDDLTQRAKVEINKQVYDRITG